MAFKKTTEGLLIEDPVEGIETSLLGRQQNLVDTEEEKDEDEEEETSFSTQQAPIKVKPTLKEIDNTLKSEESPFYTRFIVKPGEPLNKEDFIDVSRAGIDVVVGTAKLAYDALDMAQEVFTEEEWGSKKFYKFIREKSLALGIPEKELNDVLDEDGRPRETSDSLFGLAASIAPYFAGYSGIKKAIGSSSSKVRESLNVFAAAATTAQILEDPEENFSNFIVDTLGDMEVEEGLVLTIAQALAADDDDGIAMQRFKLLAQEPLFIGLGFGVGAALKGTARSLGYAQEQSRKLFNKDLDQLSPTEKSTLVTDGFLEQARATVQINQDAPLRVRMQGIKEEVVETPANLNRGMLARLSQLRKRMFSSKGQFTTNAFEAKKNAETAQRAWVSRAETVAGNLQRALDDAVDSSASSETSGKVLEALNSNTSFLNKIKDPQKRIETFADKFNFSQEVAAPTLKARELIDELTGKFDNVVLSPEVRESLGDNIGQYIRRSYRMFEDPNYIPSPLVQQEALDYLVKINIDKGMGSDAAQSNALKKLKGLIDPPDSAGNDYFEKVARLNKSIFKERKTDEQLPVEIRNLLGEIKDPSEAVLISITKASKYYENLKFYSTFNNLGKRGGYVFTERTLPTLGNTSNTLAFQKNNFELITNTNSVLDGKYTTKAMASALMQREEHFSRLTDFSFYRKFLTAKGMTQKAKTVGNPETQLRNIIGGTQFPLANGMLPGGSEVDAVKVIYTGIIKRGDEALMAKYNEYLEVGLINTSVRANEFKELIAVGFEGSYRSVARRLEESALNAAPALKGIDSALNKSQAEIAKLAGKVIEGPAGRATKKIADTAEQFYMGADDFFKIHGYEKELATLKEAFPDASEDVLRREAATLIKDTFPTYDRVSPFVKSLRELPIGNFASFPAEIIRTSVNIVRRAGKEINSGNDVLVKRGQRRLAGFALTQSGSSAAVWAGGAALGWSASKLEGATELAGNAFSKNSKKIFGTFNDSIYYVDTQPIDSYEAFHGIFSNFVGEMERGELKGNELDVKLADAVKETTLKMLQPYTGLSMLTDVIADVGWAAGNKLMDKGGKGYSGKDYFGTTMSGLDSIEAVVFEFAETFVPGGLLSAGDITDAVTQKALGRGDDPRYKNLHTELIALFTGINIKEFNPQEEIRSAAYAYGRQISGGRLRRPPINWQSNGDKVVSDLVKVEKARFENMQDLYAIYNSVTKFYGSDDNKMRESLTTLKDAGVSQNAIALTMEGAYVPTKLSDDLGDAIYRRANDPEGGGTALEVVEDLLRKIGFFSLDASFDSQMGRVEDRANKERDKKAKGGQVDNVPNASPEPDERIDKMTGLPYNQQAGTAFVDKEDRQDPLQRLGFVRG
jgi:hypothetical protein